MVLDELSLYRSRVLCSTVEPPPIGRLPVIDPSDAQNAVEFPHWHAYIERVYPGSTRVRDLNNFSFFYWFAPLRIDSLHPAEWRDGKPEIPDGTPCVLDRARRLLHLRIFRTHTLR